MEKIPNVMLLLETSRGYGRGLLRGIAKYTSIHGPWNMYREPEFYLSQTNKKKRFIFQPAGKSIDGIIMREQPNTEEILELGIPTVIALYRQENFVNIPCIDVDNAKIGQIAAEHFLERGFRNFAYCGFDSFFWSIRRSNSFAKKLSEEGYSVNFYSKPTKRSFIPWEDEQIFICDWLKSLPKPVGLFTCNDDRGEQIIDACKISGIHIPDEIAVLGVDNDEFACTLSTPSLSRIALNTEQGGFKAAKLLSRLMAGEKKLQEKVVLISPLQVETRQSTDILAIEDAEVAKAVHFIRTNSKMPIQVNDVVEVTNLSRCGLYLRFHKSLGHSVHDEIKRARTDIIAHLLLNSDLSISQIALELGFSDSNHIARFFKKVKGITPLNYRKKYNFR